MTAKFTIADDSTNPPLNLTERSTAPSSPASNDVYLDDGTNTASGNPSFRRYTGSAWEDIGTSSAVLSADQLILNDGSELTIATGVITVTNARHTVDTESDAASDDLVTISGTVAGETFILSANNTARSIVLKNGSDNIICATGDDITLEETYQAVLCVSDGTNVTAYPLFSSGGGSETFIGLSDSPADYSGDAGKVVKVNDSADALTFQDYNTIAAFNELYTGVNSGEYTIGLAYGNDLSEKLPYVRTGVITAGSGWESDHVKDPVIIDVDGVLYMYYSGNDGTSYAVGLARSYDRGVTWTKYASNPVLDHTQAWENDGLNQAVWAKVRYDPNDSSQPFKMWYAGGQFGAGGIGYAYSTDGISWTKYASNPVLDIGTGGAWDDAYILPGTVVKVGNTYTLYYAGNNGSGAWGVGTATFTNPESTYTKGASNPVLAGDGISSGIATSNAVSISDTEIVVDDSSVFPIGAPVWVYDGSGQYLTHVVERDDSTDTLTMADAAPRAIADTGTVVSVAFNSISPNNAWFDGTRLVIGITPFQPYGSNLRETAMVAYAASVDDPLQIDYATGLQVPISLADSQLTDISIENQWVLRLDKPQYDWVQPSDPTDATAIHNNVAGEISALTEKVTPISADLLIIEDSADSNNKKKVQIGNLPSGGSLTVEEVDGTPSVSSVNTIVVSNGTLTDDGSGQVTITTGGGGSVPTERASVINTSVQSIPNSSATALNFTSEEYDTDNFHDNATNNTRLTAPADGTYVLNGCVGFAANSTGYRHLRFLKNGSTIVTLNQQPNSATANHFMSITDTLRLSSGDYIELIAVQDSGGSLNTVIITGSTTYFKMTRIQ